MTKDETLKLSLQALEGLINRTSSQSIYSFMETERRIAMSACVGIRKALAQHDSVQAKPEPEQEPVAWQTMEAKYPTLEKLDIRMGDGSILCNLWLQSDGDLWWEGSGTGEKFIDPKYANVTHWRVHSDTTPPQRTWVGLTDEEIQECYNEAYKIVQGRRLEVAFYQAIEAKLKEKNT